MALSYLRTIRFADTDAAGVVYFANTLSICHEAYEESLQQAGIELKSFFSAHQVLVPISRSQAEYLRPLACGDQVRVNLRPRALNENAYAIDFEVFRAGRVDKLAARVSTEHVCISTVRRERAPLPEGLRAWIEAGSV